MTLREQVLKHGSGLSPDRIQFPQFDHLEMSSINKAVLFVFAPWSGPSVASWRTLCRELESNPKSDFPVLVIDAEGYDGDCFMKTFGKVSHGKGEAFWILKGNVVRADDGYNAKNEELLSAWIRDFSSR